jgi:formylglycine-generating enzyme required for sulfatase activity
MTEVDTFTLIRLQNEPWKGASRCRPAARHPEPVDTSTSHVGFRCVVRQAGGPR